MEQSPWEMVDSWLLCAWIYLYCILYTVEFICIYVYINNSPATILSWMVDLKAVLIGWRQWFFRTRQGRFTEGYGVSGSPPNLSNLNGWIVWIQILKRWVLRAWKKLYYCIYKFLEPLAAPKMVTFTSGNQWISLVNRWQTGMPWILTTPGNFQDLRGLSKVC